MAKPGIAGMDTGRERGTEQPEDTGGFALAEQQLQTIISNEGGHYTRGRCTSPAIAPKHTACGRTACADQRRNKMTTTTDAVVDAIRLAWGSESTKPKPTAQLVPLKSVITRRLHANLQIYR